MTSILPETIVTRDNDLNASHGRAVERLAKLRWHWTLDETNPDRVPLRAYARAVAVTFSTIHKYAHGYDAWTKINADRASAITLTECIERAGLSAEKQARADAIAKAQNISFQAAKQRHADMRAVRDIAEGRAARRGTTPTEEIQGAAEDLHKTRQAAKANAETKKQHAGFARTIILEGHLVAARRRLTGALEEATDLDFTADETETIARMIRNLKALLDLIDMRITGTTGIDWDAELARLGGDNA